LYTVRVRRSAAKEIEQLDFPVQQRIAAAIDGLAAEPRPRACLKLAGPADLWRVRIGDYRIVYQIDDVERLVRIVVVRHRSKAYE
jgi:mRNA interferase RelE/StbE